MNCKTFDRFYKSDTSCCVITKYLLQKLPDVYIKCTFVFYYLNVTDSLLCLSHKSEKIRVQYSIFADAGYGGETDLLFVTFDAVRQSSRACARMKNDELIS